MSRPRLRASQVVAALVCALAFAALPASAPAADSVGNDFWVAFPGNFNQGSELHLFITGDTATTGTITISGLGFVAPFVVTPGTVTNVSLPSNAQIQTSGVVQNLGIHVVALAPVTVYGLNRATATTDAYLGLPTDALGTDFVVEGYKNSNIVNGSQLSVVASQSTTKVTITPKVTTSGHAAGVPFDVTLNQGDTYQLRNSDPAPADLSGSSVTSDKPIAVYGGHECANIPAGFTFCDHIVEEMTPTSTWGKSFVSMPLATRLRGDTFRVTASQAATTVKLNGATVATLNRGDIHEQLVIGPAQFTSDKPIQVMQYSNSTSFDGVTSDPFEMTIPPSEQFLASYTISTPASGFRFNFVNVVAPTSEVGSVLLDGAPIPPGDFTPIGATGFSGAQKAVALGSHTLTGPLPFGVHSYGFDTADSYGYPGGMSFSEVARVASVALAPKSATNPVGTDHCVTATVTDQFGKPLKDVRVDFSVTGVNPTTGFVFTDAAGKAQFCWHGTNAGDDAVKATVGSISDTGTKTWTSQPPSDRTPPSCAITGTGVNGSGKKYLDVTVRDTGSGLASITVTKSTNATTPVPPFTQGTTSPVVVRATKIDQNQTAVIAMTVKDKSGNGTDCDPALVDLKVVRGHRVQQLVKGLAAGERYVRIANGRPGVRRVTLKVNRKRFAVRLRPGQVRKVDIASAVQPRGGDNVRILADGRKGSTVSLVISD